MQEFDNSNIVLKLDELPKFYCKICEFKCEQKKYLDQHNKSKKHLLATCLSKQENNEINCENNEIQNTNILLKIIEDLKNDKIHQQKIIEDLQNDKIHQQKIIEDLQYQNKSILELQLLCQKSGQKNEQIKPAFCKTQYLNETCKDALNLDNFFDSIEITLENYLNMEVSFVEGISKNLTQIINTTKKPLYHFAVPMKDIKLFG
jgi:hypothetical protein